VIHYNGMHYLNRAFTSHPAKNGSDSFRGQMNIVRGGPWLHRIQSDFESRY